MQINLLLSAASLSLALLVASCKGGDSSPTAAFDAEGINLHIQHPTGTRIAPHAALPAPGNVGHIPSTAGENGEPLTCLLISEAEKAGGAIKVLPVAAVQWRHEGRMHTWIVAVPAEPEKRICLVEDFMALRLQYDHVRQALELWFRHHCMPPQAEWLGWQNEVYAEEEVYRSAQRFNQ